ncbi:cell division cycle-related protein [Marasmius crinis-equi]|uniref:Cell division cycle-related protein n=1 Tax=Marasmius crinis-equi TaxID=585013 RepID=A0ABR3FEP9_9AGAR
MNTECNRALEPAPEWDNPQYTQIWNDVQRPTLLQAGDLAVCQPRADEAVGTEEDFLRHLGLATGRGRSTAMEAAPVVVERPPIHRESPVLRYGLNRLVPLGGDVVEESPQHLLGFESDASDIIIDARGAVIGGTIDALVKRLPYAKTADPHFFKTFLMTFRTFTTPEELFSVLVQVLWISPRLELHTDDEQRSVEMEQIVVRATTVFDSLLATHDVLEEEDVRILRSRLIEFARSDIDTFPPASQLLAVVDRSTQSQEDGRGPIVNTSQTPPPRPIFPKTKRKLDLLDIDPLELARQFTLMECCLYQKIRPMEWLRRVRAQEPSENRDNIAAVVRMSNRIVDWVAQSILSKNDSKRVATIRHLISIADHCRTLNNFSTMIAIVSGLNNPSVSRLKRTWDRVNQTSIAHFGACVVALDTHKNFKKYCLLLDSVMTPCVPFIGVFLLMLQFIEDDSPDMLPGDRDFINFSKRRQAAEIITGDIQRLQACSYNFETVPVVRTYIEESLWALSDMPGSSERFWAMSLEVEPPEREDEKTSSRWLQSLRNVFR